MMKFWNWLKSLLGFGGAKPQGGGGPGEETPPK